MQFRGFWELGLSVVLFLPVFAQDSSLDKLVARGRELQEQGHFTEAEAVFRVALEEAQQRKSEPLLTAAVLDSLASNAADDARFSDSERLYLKALSITERATGRDSRAVATLLWHFASLYAEAGRMTAAEPLLQRYESIILSLPTENSSIAAAELGNVARIYSYKHSINKALSLFEKAVDILRRETNPSPIDMTRALLDRAAALAMVHELDRAVADVEGASEWIARMAQSPPALQIHYLLTAGFVYAHGRRDLDSKSAFEQAIRIAESCYGPTHPILGLMLKDYSQSLRLMGDKKLASTVAKRGQRIAAANSQAQMLGYSVDIYALRR